MTTGTRLKNHSIWPKIAGAIFSTTLWTIIGTGVGYHVGNTGGFKRGVQLTTNLVLELMETKEAKLNVKPPRKYTDL
jgi:hypothetical protein